MNSADNGDGRRVRKVADGVTTTYVLAVLGLPQVVVETTGGSSTAYLYGHDLLEEEGTAWAWHLGDGLGSVRQLTDGDGDVTLVQGYTPFGVLLWREGSGASGYGFTGEQEDPIIYKEKPGEDSMVRDFTKIKPQELLHAICTEIRFCSSDMQAACKLLLTDEQASLSEKQQELVKLIEGRALGLIELRQWILDYLQYIQFLPTSNSVEAP